MRIVRSGVTFASNIQLVTSLQMGEVDPSWIPRLNLFRGKDFESKLCEK
jgi:hypothetical protein